MNARKLKTLAVLCGITTMTLMNSGAYAKATGGDSGGGGNALVCFNNPESVVHINANNGRIKDELFADMNFVELLDLYQAKLKRGLFENSQATIVPIYKNESVQEYLDRLIKKIGQASPRIGKLLNSGKSNLKEMIAFPQGLNPLVDYRDFGNIDRQKCVIATVIAQYNSNGEQYVQYDPRFFNLPDQIHSRESKAISLLHEYVYNDARSRGVETSDSTRLFVGKLITIGLPIQKILEAYGTFQGNIKYIAFSNFKFNCDLTALMQVTCDFLKSMSSSSSTILSSNTLLEKHLLIRNQDILIIPRNHFLESWKNISSRCETKRLALSRNHLQSFITNWKAKFENTKGIPEYNKNKISEYFEDSLKTDTVFYAQLWSYNYSNLDSCNISAGFDLSKNWKDYMNYPIDFES